ncbi:uncharacterized protein LOC129299647 isoform X1 [Prosopis cineraria]|uniref:uncharacterized protein LOC129299647 isoform X1 n=1 Tax=Prosopis cineraria TaxID=364024 RepID=UPI00240F1180|nr:uncharacterized protein LOC129299647 isoform X1 [Prosopis cineraria]
MNSGSGSEAKMESNKETQQKSDSFVIEMEAFSPANINKDSNSNSRITVQRSVSRKGWGDKKVNVAAAAIRDWDAIPAACSPSSKGCCVAGMPEKVGPSVVGSGDYCDSPRVHHHITVVTTATGNEAKSIARRNSFKRPSHLGLDPRMVLAFFSILSSIGTIVLIYLALRTSYYE